MSKVDTIAAIYDFDSFEHYVDYSSGFSGLLLYKIREVLRECVEAMSTGRIKYWYPAKGWSKEYVDKAVAVMEFEWGKETDRDAKYTHAPEFSSLSFEQKACLVERIKDIIGKDISNRIVFKEESDLIWQS